jgi:hypothetical protein
VSERLARNFRDSLAFHTNKCHSRAQQLIGVLFISLQAIHKKII